MFSTIIEIQSAYMVRKLFYVSMDTTGLNIGTGKFKDHNFFLFSQDDFWLYPSLNQKQPILCSEYIYFGYKTFLALPAMFVLLSLDVNVTSLKAHLKQHSTCPQNSYPGLQAKAPSLNIVSKTFLSFPFYFASTFSSKSLFCTLLPGISPGIMQAMRS